MKFFLEPIAPFRLDLTAWTLRRTPNNTIDRWDGQTYRRVLPLSGKPIQICVTQENERLAVQLEGINPTTDVQTAVAKSLDRLLGIHIDLSNFYAFASQDKRLKPLAARYRGFKPPRFLTVFEGLANGITCQQISLPAGISLLNRLSEAFGLCARNGQHAFPCPRDLIATDVGKLRLLGYSSAKARALLEAADAVAHKTLELENLAQLDNEVAEDRLIELRGVGRWTAQYVLLRGLGRIEIFPGDDVGTRNKLQRWLGLKMPLDYDGVQRTLAKWRPWGGLIYFHMLLKHLDEKGRLG